MPTVEDWITTQHDHPRGEPDVGRWQVHIALDRAESDVIAAAVPAVTPSEHVDVYTVVEDDSDDVLVAIRVFADTNAAAIELATETYRRMRVEAGLPAVAPRVLGYLSPWWRSNAIPDLGKEAIELHKQGRHELAVVRVQTICELTIAKTLMHLLNDAHPDAEGERLFRRPTTLRDKQTQAFLHLLTGQWVQEQKWWSRYVDHVKRRNAIIHEGVAVSRDDCLASIKVSLELREWLGSLDDESFEKRGE